MEINNVADISYAPLKSRFYIMSTFSLYLFVYFFIWNSWQPIMIPLQSVYKWTLTDINLILNLNTMTYVILITPFVLFWNKFGIKVSYYMSSLCMLIGSLAKLYPGPEHIQSTMIIFGSSVTALGNLISSIGCTAISALWFPSNERGRSTTTAMSFGALGAGIAPVVVSYMVPNNQNSSSVSHETTRSHINSVLYIHCVLTLAVVVSVMAYFPSRPSIMPCKSSNRELRIDLIPGVKKLIRNKQFGLVFGMNIFSAGIYSGVIAVLTSIVLPLGISQNDAALIKTMATFLMFVAILLSGWLCDRFGYKLVVFSTIVPSILMAVVFGLQTTDVIRHSLISVYVVIGILSFVAAILGPISYEMGCEAAFPVGEEVATAVIGLASNIATTSFLFVTMIPGIGTKWIPFAYAGCTAMLLPLTYFYKDMKNRAQCDVEYSIIL